MRPNAGRRAQTPAQVLGQKVSHDLRRGQPRPSVLLQARGRQAVRLRHHDLYPHLLAHDGLRVPQGDGEQRDQECSGGCGHFLYDCVCAGDGHEADRVWSVPGGQGLVPEGPVELHGWFHRHDRHRRQDDLRQPRLGSIAEDDEGASAAAGHQPGAGAEGCGQRSVRVHSRHGQRVHGVTSLLAHLRHPRHAALHGRIRPMRRRGRRGQGGVSRRMGQRHGRRDGMGQHHQVVRPDPRRRVLRPQRVHRSAVHRHVQQHRLRGTDVAVG